MPKRPLTNQQAIKKLNALKLNYDFSKFEYNGSRNNESTVICPKHGEFKVSYHYTTKSWSGLVCKKCRNEHQQQVLIKKRYGRGKTMKDVLIIYLNKNNPNHNVNIDTIPDDIHFSRSSKNSKVELTCKIHGKFLISVTSLLKIDSCGCPDCMNDSGRNGKRTYNIEYVQKIATDSGATCLDTKYNGYRGRHNFICEHGNTFTTSLHRILNNKVWCKCKLCKPSIKSSYGEEAIYKYLKSKNILFEREKTFPDLKGDSKMKMLLRFDFYLPDYNMLIEFDGLQHFMPVKMYGGDNGFKLRKHNDELKNSYASQTMRFLLRIPYTKLRKINTILDEYIK
jgi:hypothetical protein